MSRPKKPVTEQAQPYYSIQRKNGGYYIVKLIISTETNSVTSTEVITEPDVFQITTSKLIQLIRKELN